MPTLKHLQEYEDLQNWQLKKPATDLAWAEDVKAESLDLKFDKQLAQMKEIGIEKLPRVEKDLDKFNNWEQVIRYELTNRFIEQLPFDKNGKCEGKTLQQWIDEEFEDEHLFYTWKVAKIQQSIERIAKEQDLRARKVVLRKPIGTTYYVDSDNGNDTWDGTTPNYVSGTTGPWKTLDKFTEAARSNSDKVIIRRGRTAGIHNGTDLAFTSSGTTIAPIQIEADYDNVWGDRTDLSGTATATLTFGSKTIIFSASVAGVLAAGDVIYAAGDDNRDFAYEVATVSTVTVTLYLPYKGNQAGSGKTIYNMQDNPIWGTAAGDFQWNFDTDNNWKVQGIMIRGTDMNGQVEIDSSSGHIFKDCQFIGNDASCLGIACHDDFFYLILKKVRTSNEVDGIDLSFTIDVFGVLKIYDSALLDCSSRAIKPLNSGFRMIEIYESQIGDANSLDAIATSNLATKQTNLKSRNTIFLGTDVFDIAAGTTRLEEGDYCLEDYNGVVGDTRYFNNIVTAKNTFLFQSEAGTVRSGGATKSIKVTPTTELTNISDWDFSKLLLFEIPIYLTTDQKTFTIYFNLPAANFTDAPTASELWIELEAWGHAANNYRKITKSTGTVAKDGNWNALTVTVAPAQAGVAYLRCYYCKTLEDGKDNIFYVDPLPVIT